MQYNYYTVHNRNIVLNIKRKFYGIESVVEALGISAFSSPTAPKTLIYREATVYYYRSENNLLVNVVIMMENARYLCTKSKQYITLEDMLCDASGSLSTSRACYVPLNVFSSP